MDYYERFSVQPPLKERPQFRVRLVLVGLGRRHLVKNFRVPPDFDAPVGCPTDFGRVIKEPPLDDEPDKIRERHRQPGPPFRLPSFGGDD